MLFLFQLHGEAQQSGVATTVTHWLSQSAGAIEDGAGEYRTVVRIAWAIGCLRCGNQEVMKRIGDRMLSEMERTDGEDLASVIWSFARCNLVFATLFDTIAERVLQIADLFTLETISVVLWSYATLGYSHPELFEGVSVRVCQLLRVAQPPAAVDHVINTVWAYARAESDAASCVLAASESAQVAYGTQVCRMAGCMSPIHAVWCLHADVADQHRRPGLDVCHHERTAPLVVLGRDPARHLPCAHRRL